jgi:hypothetical protein
MPDKTNSSIGVWAVLVIIVIALGWYFMDRNSDPVTTPNEEHTLQLNTETIESNSSQNNNTAQTEAATSNISPGTTDADLDKDMSEMDKQMQGLNADESNIDKGLNDAPVDPLQ